MRFNIGDRIVYPMHGAGHVEGIEQQTVGGVLREYYCVCVLGSNIRLKIPVESNGTVRLRPIICKEDAEQVLNHFSAFHVDTEQPWGKRYKENMDRLKTGDPMEIAEVVKALMLRDKMAGLSIGDRQLMLTAKNIFVGELSMALECTCEDIREELSKTIEASIQNQ